MANISKNSVAIGAILYFCRITFGSKFNDAIATIASTINAGGLGSILFDGLRTMSLPKLLWGIILTVALSLLVNLILYLVEELVKNESVA